MALLEAEAQQRFLNQAGHLLARESPLVAANLHSEGTRLSVENEEGVSWSRRVQVCGGCGTRLTLGATSEVRIESVRFKREAGERKGIKPSSSKEGVTPLVPKTLIVECLVCKSRASHPLQRADRATVKIRRHQVGESTPDQSPSSLSAAEARATTTSTVLSPSPIPTTAPTTKTGSRKRSRAGKQKSLQALLSKNKGLLAKHEQDTTSTGLDLLDLMRESSS